MDIEYIFVNYLLYFIYDFLGIIASIFLVLCHITNILLPECETTCYIGILPNAFVAIAFMLFFPTIWCIIPDVAYSKILGTAFGFATIFYNS